MVKGEMVVEGKRGLHARPSLLISDIARRYPDTRITVRSVETGEEVDAKSILSLMALAVEGGSAVILSSDGEDEEKAFAEVSEVLRTFKVDEC